MDRMLNDVYAFVLYWRQCVAVGKWNKEEGKGGGGQSTPVFSLIKSIISLWTFQFLREVAGYFDGASERLIIELLRFASCDCQPQPDGGTDLSAVEGILVEGLGLFVGLGILRGIQQVFPNDFPRLFIEVVVFDGHADSAVERGIEYVYSVSSQEEYSLMILQLA